MTEEMVLLRDIKSKLKLLEDHDIKNTLRNINTDLYSFLTDRQTFVNKLSNTNVIKTNSVLQVGKYFKKGILKITTTLLHVF